MKKFIIYLLIVGVFVGGKAYDTNTRNKAKFEARKELDQEKERIVESLKIDGINESYDGEVVIEIDGEFYEYRFTTQDSEKDFVCKW